MNYRCIFDAKIYGTNSRIVFDFASSLAAGETLTSASVTAAVYSGTDPTPSTLISGAATIGTVNASQTVADGVVGVTYLVACVATTSLGYMLVRDGYLLVKNAGS